VIHQQNRRIGAADMPFASLKLKSFVINKQRANITILFVLQTPPDLFPLQQYTNQNQYCLVAPNVREHLNTALPIGNATV
jgi:hypothetical protein